MKWLERYDCSFCGERKSSTLGMTTIGPAPICKECDREQMGRIEKMLNEPSPIWKLLAKKEGSEAE